MYKPTVSIIIPTFNRSALLKRAIESVINQNYENIIEIIITDDNSTDDTEKIVKEYQKKDSRIIYTKNSKYKPGPTGNKNNGLDLAKGEFIGILDDDDILLPDAVSKLVNIYLEKGYWHILANCLRSDNNKLSGKSYGKSEEVTYIDVICGKYEGEYWRIFHRDLLGNRRYPDDTWGAECVLEWQLLRLKPAYYLDVIVRIYNVENELSVSKKYYKFPERTFLNYKYILDIYGQDMKNFCPKNFIRYCIQGSIFAKLSGKYRNALQYSLKAFEVKGLFLLKFLLLVFAIIPIPKSITRILYSKILLKMQPLVKKLLKL